MPKIYNNVLLNKNIINNNYFNESTNVYILKDISKHIKICEHLVGCALNKNLINSSIKEEFLWEININKKITRHTGTGAVVELHNGIYAWITKTSKLYHLKKENILVGSYLNEKGIQKNVYICWEAYTVNLQKDDLHNKYKLIENCSFKNNIFFNNELLNLFKKEIQILIEKEKIYLNAHNDMTKYIYFEDTIYGRISLYLYENKYGDEMIFNVETKENVNILISNFIKEVKEDINHEMEGQKENEWLLDEL